jgi:ribosomal protein S18 acetylase RimI-like enzyme
MRRRGMERARLSHAVDNLPAGALYSGLGFERRDQTFGYTWALDSDGSLAER